MIVGAIVGSGVVGAVDIAEVGLFDGFLVGDIMGDRVAHSSK